MNSQHLLVFQTYSFALPDVEVLVEVEILAFAGTLTLKKELLAYQVRYLVLPGTVPNRGAID